jgi:hypothetical protein
MGTAWIASLVFAGATLASLIRAGSAFEHGTGPVLARPA